MQSHDNKDAKKEVTGAPAFFSKEKKPDPVLEVKFDADKHKKLLEEGGEWQFTEEKEKVILKHLRAGKNSQGRGFGTAVFRELVQRSIDLGCAGEIKTDATSGARAEISPHLFYLYMGMAPEAKKVPYFIKHYGNLKGRNMQHAVTELLGEDEWTAQALEELALIDEDLLDDLKGTLRREEKYDRKKEVSLDEIIANKALFLQLAKKEFNSLTKFIDDILQILKNNPHEKFPNTGKLGAQGMRLTKKGYARWKDAIDNNKEFVSFKNFEHLDLTADQQKLLEEILAQRAAPKHSP